jgi:hypothetical protein
MLGAHFPFSPGVQFKYRKAESKKFKIPRMFQHLEWEKNDAEDVSLSTVGLYDKNGRRVRIARKKQEVQVLDEIEDGSSDDSSGVPDFDTLKVVSKRAIKVFPINNINFLYFHSISCDTGTSQKGSPRKFVSSAA